MRVSPLNVKAFITNATVIAGLVPAIQGCKQRRCLARRSVHQAIINPQPEACAGAVMFPLTDERAHQRFLARVGAIDLGDVEGGERRVHMFERVRAGLRRAALGLQGGRQGVVQMVEGEVGGRGTVVRCVELHALTPVVLFVVCVVAAVTVVSVTVV